MVMASFYQPIPKRPSRLDDGKSHLPADQALALLRECLALFQERLLGLARSSLEQTDDLFESTSHIPDGEIQRFLNKRGEWLDRFPGMLKDLFERRLAGNRRKGRRPDADASLATLRVLTAFDHEKQAALIAATAFLQGFTRRERSALDLRVDELLGEELPGEFDNPFSIDYVVDALGATSRAIYPDPRVWRPLLERLLADVRPVINKIYLAINRTLADRGVLPEIKAELRARSEFRPRDDRDLFGAFAHMLGQAEPGLGVDVVVPDAQAQPGVPPPLVFAEAAASPPPPAAVTPSLPEMDADTILTGLAALAEAGARLEQMAPGGATRTPGPVADGAELPGLDPLMALGTSTPLFETLAQWQKLDLNAALADVARANAPDGTPGVIVPLNLIPHIRAAIAEHITNPADAITMDVMALLFDYIFRDASISETTRPLFGRLQVPIVKAALLDRTFFSDRYHPARLFLDHLADAAIGTAHHEEYRTAFVAMAQDVIDDIVTNFQIDITVFQRADARVREFIELDRSRSATAVSEDVTAARTAEENEADRAEVVVVVRDRLAGLTFPFEVRAFVETVWVDYLTGLRERHGAASDEFTAALATLDDLLWSVVVKERSGQKVRLAKLIPGLVAGLRKGCVARALPPERAKAFFEAIYQLHMAAIKPEAAIEVAAAPPVAPAINVHDYVSEMVVGTWLTFSGTDEDTDARLTYVSPMRTKYVFTGRYHSTALVFTPEELAYNLGSGKARVLAEPVPLWDRAVSAALDTLAARNPSPSPYKPHQDPNRLPA